MSATTPTGPSGLPSGATGAAGASVVSPAVRPEDRVRDVRILMIDNYDSFTYNLVQYLGEISAGPITVYRNDKIDVEGIRSEAPTHVIISPGPCTPNEAGVSLDVVRSLAGEFPLLGVCLGHQSIGQAFGGSVVRGEVPVHGKTSEVHHDGRTIFAGVASPFTATRYHSLVVRREDLPDSLEVSGWTEDGVVMAIRHREFVVEGVQFHPESILTAPGKDILRNFLRERRTRWDEAPADTPGHGTAAGSPEHGAAPAGGEGR